MKNNILIFTLALALAIGYTGNHSASLPEGFTTISLSDSFENHLICDYSFYRLSNDVMGVLYQDPTETPVISQTGVILLDKAGKHISTIALGEMHTGFTDGLDIYVNDGKLNIIEKVLSEDGMLQSAVKYAISAKGLLTTENIQNDSAVRLQSPDGTKAAYTENYNLYLSDKNGTRLVLCKKAGTSPNVFTPYRWIDDRYLIYKSDGYDLGFDWGVVDTKTYEITKNVGPIDIYQNKVYSVRYGEAILYNVSVLDLKYPMQKPVLLLPQNYIPANSVSITEDHTRIAIFQQGYQDQKPNQLTIYSLGDGSKLKDCSFYQDRFGSDVVFLDNNLVGLFWDKDLVLVDLTKLNSK